MKTFSIDIKELFTKGLRPRTDIPINGKFMELCTNAKPAPYGLVNVPKYTRRFNLNFNAYVFDCYAGVFVATNDTFYTYDGISLTPVLTGIPTGNSWNCADFKEYIVFSNGFVNVIRDATGTISIDPGIILPVAKAICNFRGRLILGNFKYDSTRDIAYGMSNWVGWSEIGKLEFPSLTALSTVRKNTAGFMPMPWGGSVHKILPLGKSVVVYGDKGISALLMAMVGDTATFGLKHISDIGLLNKDSAVSAGKEDRAKSHFYVRSDGKLFSIDINLETKDLGYAEFLK